MSATRLGFAMTGSFCTFHAVLAQIKVLCGMGYDVLPVLSRYAASTDTRFMTCGELTRALYDITGHEALTRIEQVEPIGPQKLLDCYVLAPATGASMGKMACGVFDGPALLGVKSHLRNGRPVVVAPSTNDGLGAAAENIGKIMNMKNVYIVPFGQDDAVGKPRSVMADFSLLPAAVAAALAGAQLQPMLVPLKKASD